MAASGQRRQRGWGFTEAAGVGAGSDPLAGAGPMPSLGEEEVGLEVQDASGKRPWVQKLCMGVPPFLSAC